MTAGLALKSFTILRPFRSLNSYRGMEIRFWDTFLSYEHMQSQNNRPTHVGHLGPSLFPGNSTLSKSDNLFTLGSNI